MTMQVEHRRGSCVEGALSPNMRVPLVMAGGGYARAPGVRCRLCRLRRRDVLTAGSVALPRSSRTRLRLDVDGHRRDDPVCDCLGGYRRRRRGQKRLQGVGDDDSRHLEPLPRGCSAARAVMAQKPGPDHFRGGADFPGRHRRAEAGLHELRLRLPRLPDLDHVGATVLSQPAQMRDEPRRPVPGTGLRSRPSWAFTLA
jgi:hypothetical protein